MSSPNTQPAAGPYPALLPFSVKTYPVVQLAKPMGPQQPASWPTQMDPHVAAWRSAVGGAHEPVNMIYLHVPFCPFLCGYCPLYKVQSAADRQISVKELFVQALISEIEMYGRAPAVASVPFAGVYFGGGTPSELTAEQIRRILDALRRNFQLTDDAEITLEGVARQMAVEDYLAPLYDNGVNRISFGVQSLDSVVRQRIGRGDQVEDYHRLIALSRHIRPDVPINVDMMSGLSEQSHASLVSDMEEVSSWDLNSVDVLFYIAMPGTRLHRQIKEGTRRAPDYGHVQIGRASCRERV
jgi:coproporphyrinogen III oxidase-like Fe-S oxidoreductase